MECEYQSRNTTSSSALCTPLCSGYAIFLVFVVFDQSDLSHLSGYSFENVLLSEAGDVMLYISRGGRAD